MALTTLEAVKKYLAAEVGDTTDDAEIERLLGAASARFEQIAGRTFARTTYTNEIQNGPPYGGRCRASIIPKNYPVISASSVTVDGVTVPALANGSGWALVDDVIHLVGYRISPGVANVSITYDAGYTTVPEDVAQAVVELTAWMYKAKTHIGIASRVIGDSPTTYIQPAGDGLPPNVAAAAESYRRIGVA